MRDLLEDLNPQQREAVTATEGPLLILAGAGSGKTRAITYRIAYLMNHLGVGPESILAVTFTNKAADQMKQRVAKLIGHDMGSQPHISTFHSFCVRVLRREIDGLGISRNFSIYDGDAQLATVKACVRELGLEDQVTSPRAALARISYAKNRDLPPESLYAQRASPGNERIAALYARYNEKLRRAEALDFDDLLLKTVALFDQLPEVREAYNRHFRYLLVDEFQDTNRLQYSLIRHLTRLHRNLCAVGDEDQSIYRWRGAEVENILNFEEDFPGTRVIRLEQNYRSTQIILDAATAVVSHNRARKGKNLYAVRSGGRGVGFFEASTGEEEAQFVARQIAQAHVKNPDHTVGVLYRTNAQSRLLEEAMRRVGTDYRLVGGISFYDRAEVKDVLAYARLAINPSDSASLARVINMPTRGLGKLSLQRMEASAQRADLTLAKAIEKGLFNRKEDAGDASIGQASPTGTPGLSGRSLQAVETLRKLLESLRGDLERAPLAEFFRLILSRTGYLSMLEKEDTPERHARAENLQELVNAASEAEERGEPLTNFLDHAALLADPDQYDEKARVTLMTLHSAKGLEFSQVFLVGLEEGLLPHAMSLDEEAELEEERRLCYVGMTRAENQLCLSRALFRRSYAYESSNETRPSRFLAEIPPDIIEPIVDEALMERPRTSWEGSINSPKDIEQFFRRRGRSVTLPSRRPSARASRGGATLAIGQWAQGTKVRHPKFGLGTVVDCEGEGEETKLTIRFRSRGVKKIMEKYVALEKV